LRSPVRGFDVSVSDDVSLRVRRCWDENDGEVVEVCIEGGSGSVYTSVSSCLTPIQASALAYHLMHEANVPMEVK
jgi:hypothetical protein